jgi:uncharacterized protein DUF5655
MTIESYLQGQDPDAVALFRRFQQLVEQCGPSDPALRRTIVYWRRKRIFAGAYIERRRLELNIDLLRDAEHPCLLAAFLTTKRVITHRLRITELDQLDQSIAALVAEAYEEVGPGTRGRS